MVKNISTLTFNATSQAVWDALTKPEMVKLWQYGSELSTDWQPGSEIRFRTEWQGTVFEQWGTILDIQPNKLISFSLFAPRPGVEDKPENYFVMNYILAEADGKTRLEIIQEDGRPNAVQEAPQGEENPVLQGLKSLVESGNN